MTLEALPNGVQSTTSAVLTDWIRDADRPAFLLSLVRSLRAEDSVSINFVASLFSHKPDPQAENHFISFLGQSIEQGSIDAGVQVCSRYPKLGVKLLQGAVQAFAKSISAHSQDKLDIQSSFITDDRVHSCIDFSSSVISVLPIGSFHADLFSVCLESMTASGLSTSAAAFNLMLKLLSLDDPDFRKFIAEQWTVVRHTVTTLVTSESGDDDLRGYSMWLRYILTVPSDSWRSSIDSEYWQLLLRGLRHGDSERRKLCLNIIKLSVAADQNLVSNNAPDQYERYITVFETIVLGRYINQIQECEADLTALTNNGAIERTWLYVLLASALDPRMQESNRKFIGNWVMRSKLDPDFDFMTFFRDDFLPWAIQGSLFVSSLRTDGETLRCIHGDSLATFIKRLRGNGTTLLVDTIVNVMHEKCNTIFAYAVVYLLEGVADILQQRHMSQIAQVKALPEVARDYVKSKTSTIENSVAKPKAQSRRETLEVAAIDKGARVGGDVTGLNDIWADLDDLGFPKRLLMVFSKALLNPELIAAAVQNKTITESLNEKLRTLQKASSTKPCLFSPLVGAIRQAILADPRAITALPIANLIIQIMEHPPAPTIDLQLEEAALHLTVFDYEDYFGERPSYGFAALVDLVSRLRYHQEVVETILRHTVSKLKAQKVPPPTISAWKNTLQLQVLFLCIEQYDPGPDEAVQELLNSLLHILSIEPLPRYRYLLEATIVRLIIRLDLDLQENVIDQLNTKDHHSNPKHLASLMKIGAILACREESTAVFAESLAATFVALAASSKVIVRHEAQWRVPILMDHCRARRWAKVTENPAYASLDSYIRSLERFSDPPRERRIGTFDPDKDFTLSNLVEGQWFDLDQLERPLTSHDEFEKLYAKDRPPRAPPSCIPLGPRINRETSSQYSTSDSPAMAAPPIGPRTETKSTALQTKGTAYLSRTLSDPTSQTKRPHDLIVVGSLVDNPYNLGGLSRVSEIFGAAALTLQNQNVVSNRDFTSVSVSSHLHFPIIQLSAPNIPAFLAERKGEGYTVVGIEQTDRSVMLGYEKCKLSEKVVLVVGSEKEGIPAVVLTACDMLVEIPQAGVTRSLNVQTAVGIVLFEYARQREIARGP